MTTSAAASLHSDKDYELIELYTEDGKPTGKASIRDVIHSQGLPHKVIHVWVVNDLGQLVLQQRSKLKKAHPGLWDISSAGHIVFGETTLEAAKKELGEELGLHVEDEKCLELIFSIFNEFSLNNGTYIDREWVDVFLMKVDDLRENNLAQRLVLQQEEVDGVCLVHYTQLEQLLREAHPALVQVANANYFQLFDLMRERYPVAPGSSAALVDLSLLQQTAPLPSIQPGSNTNE